jgi:valyl-tRNA synthetase
MDPNDLDATFASGRNFANKLWNIGRLVLGQLGDAAASRQLPAASGLTLADRWILSRLAATIGETTEHLERFRLNDATGTPYHFLWDDFADWYLESIKPRLAADNDPADREVALAVATHCFGTALKLLHPTMPFITEALYRRLPGNTGATIVTGPWPVAEGRHDAAAEREFAFLQAVVRETREIRARFEVKPSQLVNIAIEPGEQHARLSGNGNLAKAVMWLARVGTIAAQRSGQGVTAVLPEGATLFVELGDATDLARQCQRLRDEHGRLEKQLGGLRGKLQNQGFIAKAPPEIIEAERAKEREWGEKVERLARTLQELGC